MAKSKDINDPDSVSAYVQKLEPILAETVETVRAIILSTDKEIGEQIKWNAPSFFYTGNMKAFDPKEYKRDIAVMNIRKGFLMLVLPTGSQIADTTGLLEGDYTDGRRLVTINDSKDARAKEKSLQKIIKDWIKLVDK